MQEGGMYRDQSKQCKIHVLIMYEDCKERVDKKTELNPDI